MSNPFLDEKLPVGVRMGASYADEYAVEITRTANNAEHRRLVHPYPVRICVVSFTMLSDDMLTKLLALYHRAYGMFAGFRVEALDDRSTAAGGGSPSAFDQLLEVVTLGSVYRLQKQYGSGSTPLSIGLPVRTIFKPITGSTVVGIRNSLSGDHVTTAWTVDTATGVVTMAANKTKAVTAITNASQAEVTLGASHGMVVGDSLHVSGVAGMTQINGRRGAVMSTTATTAVVGINSTGFSTYTSGGTVNTRPQTGEEVRGGCRFDIPCRFNGRIDVNHVSKDVRETGSIEIVELINP
jgi:uncharacterized protein (TIGR02217 family)